MRKHRWMIWDKESTPGTSSLAHVVENGSLICHMHGPGPNLREAPANYPRCLRCECKLTEKRK